MTNEKDYTLRKQAEQLSMMMDTVPVQLWFLSDIDTYGMVNQCHASFFGRQKHEMEFMRLESFLPAEIANACRQSNRKVFEAKKEVYSEEWIQDSTGKQCLIGITKTPYFDQEGNIEYIVCYGVDITEQRNTEIMLSQSEKNFRTFIETIDDIFVVGNYDGSIIYSNPATSSKLGYSDEELLKMHIIDFHPEYLQKEATSILHEMFNGRQNVCPLPLLNKNGKLVPVETRIWHGQWNGIQSIFGLSKDLSREQEALQKFDRLFRMNPAPMAVTELPERLFIDVNDAFIRTLGYSRNEIIGKTSYELNIFPDENDRKLIAETIAQYGQFKEIEMKFKTKSGDSLIGLFSGEIIESQAKRYFLTVMIDITEKIHAQEEYKKIIQELQNALQEIKTLRGIIPICANCKKIRNDNGYWEQVELYISKHTTAQFSHGICPECVKKLYPDLRKDKLESTNK